MPADPDRARTRRLRRLAEAHGLRLQRSRFRMDGHPQAGLFWLYTADDPAQPRLVTDGFGVSLDVIEDYLRSRRTQALVDELAEDRTRR